MFLISIHAPSRERRFTCSPMRPLREFQSTLPHGSDTRCCRAPWCVCISIHAPSRERVPNDDPIGVNLIFQSTLPHGSDYNHTAKAAPEWEFQSTLPHGSDSICIGLHSLFLVFQSTLPHGSDCQDEIQAKRLFISIHAPSRERLLLLFYSLHLLKFQSTLPHGSEIKQLCKCSLASYFNPRSLTGAKQRTASKNRAHQFQSTLPHGSD